MTSRSVVPWLLSDDPGAIEELYEQIGRLKLELEWLKQKRECLIERGESVQGQRAHWVAMAE